MNITVCFLKIWSIVFMEKRYVIYKVTNSINGKVYVGKTYNFEKRKREHIYDIEDNLPFHRALKKYGIDNFVWEIIDKLHYIRVLDYLLSPFYL